MNSKILVKCKKDRGITLIALIVTIIVLLILAGVTINMLTGENGIINQAQKAKIETRAGTVKEESNLWKVSRENGGTETLKELLNDLESQNLITSEERKTIEATGKVTIGSQTIIFVETTEDDEETQEPVEPTYYTVALPGDLTIKKDSATDYANAYISTSARSTVASSSGATIIGDIQFVIDLSEFREKMNTIITNVTDKTIGIQGEFTIVLHIPSDITVTEFENHKTSETMNGFKEESKNFFIDKSRNWNEDTNILEITLQPITSLTLADLENNVDTILADMYYNMDDLTFTLASYSEAQYRTISLDYDMELSLADEIYISGTSSQVEGEADDYSGASEVGEITTTMALKITSSGGGGGGGL